MTCCVEDVVVSSMVMFILPPLTAGQIALLGTGMGAHSSTLRPAVANSRASISGCWTSRGYVLMTPGSRARTRLFQYSRASRCRPGRDDRRRLSRLAGLSSGRMGHHSLQWNVVSPTLFAVASLVVGIPTDSNKFQLVGTMLYGARSV